MSYLPKKQVLKYEWQWDNFVRELVAKLFIIFDYAEDKLEICPVYDQLSISQRIEVWCRLIKYIAYYESNWNPGCQTLEPTMGIDPTTKEPVKSEGLLQLSYQDKINYPTLKNKCRFDAAQKDSILNPEYNLEFGIYILADQIKKYKKVFLKDNVYWAVLKRGGRYQKIKEIIKQINASPF